MSHRESRDMKPMKMLRPSNSEDEFNKLLSGGGNPIIPSHLTSNLSSNASSGNIGVNSGSNTLNNKISASQTHR